MLQHVEPAIYLFKDFHPFTEENRANLAVIRRLKDVAYHLRDTYKTIVIVASVLRMAPELDKDVTLLQFLPPGVRRISTSCWIESSMISERQSPEVKIQPRPGGAGTAGSCRPRTSTLKES